MKIGRTKNVVLIAVDFANIHSVGKYCTRKKFFKHLQIIVFEGASKLELRKEQ